jgi:hypothetical protein
MGALGGFVGLLNGCIASGILGEYRLDLGLLHAMPLLVVVPILASMVLHWWFGSLLGARFDRIRLSRREDPPRDRAPVDQRRLPDR